MSTPIDGYRRNHEKTLPELLTECEKKVATAAADLAEQEEALEWVKREMSTSKLKRRPEPDAVDVVSVSNRTSPHGSSATKQESVSVDSLKTEAV